MFKLPSESKPTGDQPQAIEYLSSIQRELLRIKAEEEEKKEKVF